MLRTLKTSLASDFLPVRSMRSFDETCHESAMAMIGCALVATFVVAEWTQAADVAYYVPPTFERARR
jgi:hypothetical protein